VKGIVLEHLADQRLRPLLDVVESASPQPQGKRLGHILGSPSGGVESGPSRLTRPDAHQVTLMLEVSPGGGGVSRSSRIDCWGSSIGQTGLANAVGVAKDVIGRPGLEHQAELGDSWRSGAGSPARLKTCRSSYSPFASQVMKTAHAPIRPCIPGRDIRIDLTRMPRTAWARDPRSNALRWFLRSISVHGPRLDDGKPTSTSVKLACRKGTPSSR